VDGWFIPDEDAAAGILDKNLPFQFVSAAVTIPLTEMGTADDASLAVSASTSEALVSVSRGWLAAHQILRSKTDEEEDIRRAPARGCHSPVKVVNVAI